MNIAILSFYGGLNDRGVEPFVHEISTRLVSLGHQVTVYQNGKSRIETNYKTEYLPSIFLLPPFKQDPDVIIPTNGILQTALTRIWTLLHRKKYIAVGRAGLSLDDKLNLFTFPDVFVGLTDYQCQWAGKINPLVPNVKISSGVALDQYSPSVSPFNFNLDGRVVLYVGGLEPFAGLDQLISAISKTNLSLAIVGHGSLKDSLEESGHKLLGKRRFGIFSVDQHSLPAAFTACSVFAYPALLLGSSDTGILKALSSNRPVVTTDYPTRREIIGDAGIFVDPAGGADKFATALNAAVSRSWDDLPRKRAEDFSWDEVANRYHSLFTKLYEHRD